MGLTVLALLTLIARSASGNCRCGVEQNNPTLLLCYGGLREIEPPHLCEWGYQGIVHTALPSLLKGLAWLRMRSVVQEI
jgi:hypothetical protein